MQRATSVVRWPNGLHLRPAVLIVRLARRFRSRIRLTCEGRVADVRSILSVIALCAAMGAGVEIEASGDDELEAVQAIEQFFAAPSPGDAVDTLAAPPP